RSGKDIADGEACLHLGEHGEAVSKAEDGTTRRFASEPQRKLRYNPGPRLSHFWSRVTCPPPRRRPADSSTPAVIPAAAAVPNGSCRTDIVHGRPDWKGTEVTVTTLSLRVQPFRLLTKAEAAHFCRRSVKKFEAQCPVPPIEMADGDRLW